MRLLFLLFILFNSLNGQSISSISPKSITGGIADVLTIKGSGFGSSRGSSFVSFYNENLTYSSNLEGGGFNYISWTDSEIKLEMPGAFSNRIKLVINGNSIFSKDTLHIVANVGYRQLNPLIYDLLTDNNGLGGVTWFVHPVFWKNPEIKQAIIDVISEFRCKTGVNYTIEEMTKWSPLNLSAGVHIIGPDSNLSVVGFNEKLWSSCVNGGETFFFNKIQLLRINTKQDWYYGKGKAPNGKSKFRYVLYHEIGHSLGLGHVNELGQSMFPSVNLLPSDNWSERDSITTAEKEAIIYYVNKCQTFNFRGCGIIPMKRIINCRDVETNLNAISHTQKISELVIYPNPCFSDEISIKPLTQTINSLGTISVYNSIGALVFKDEYDAGQIHTMQFSFPNGNYFFKIDPNGISYSKIMKVQN
jgi:hypothetical protein